ncbi:hypothetical protein LMG19282_02290 [Cupriavidus campinensis]|uniref:PilW family protein n=1 Tax=Cupriavidus campinensis TaxID=151783 RepID=A0AAE9I0L7_9BURK|nr:MULTISPECIES: PilW family protein [Cupriavidus]URF03370.1 PilW family protein [Cupriavidus campinensis]CAG2142775.1 hypothetical protein LMG19282_02290 [Cupriavidus campinensis]
MKRRYRLRGFTLTGMMVGMVLGLLASVLAITTFQVVRHAYANVADSVMMAERGHRALGIVAQLVRQAGWIPGQAALAPGHPAPTAPLEGHDDCGQPAIDLSAPCGARGRHYSDALRLRFSGSSSGETTTRPDGTMTDCGGHALAATAQPVDGVPASHHAAMNLLYIGLGSDGVPQLLCRYPRRQGRQMQAVTYTSGTLVRGVETMQLRYGVDQDGDGEADTYLRARDIRAQGDAGWHRVRTVQIGLVIRGDRATGQTTRPEPLTLLPALTHGDADEDLSFPPATRHAVRRRAFTATFRLRNPSPCLEALC